MSEPVEASCRLNCLNKAPRFSLGILLAALAICSPAPASPSGRTTTTVYVGRNFEVRDHDQPTKYVFNGSTRVAEITGSLSANSRVQRLRLYPGWNLCSLAVTGPFPASGAEAISAAYQWGPGTGDYSPITLGQSLVAGKVLWIKAGTNADVSVLGAYSDPAPQPVQAGGAYFPGAGLEVWSPALPDGASSWDFDASSGQWFNHLAGDLASVTGPPPTLSPGQAFYVQAAALGALESPDPTLRIRYYHQDHLGSSSVITDADSALVEETAFYPFGHPRNEYEPRQIREPYEFTQKERDRETGLHYFEARYMDAGLARFISADPAYAALDRLPAEKRQAVLLRPQLLNLYCYALNSPARIRDPTGLEVVKLDWVQTVQAVVAQKEAIAMLDYSIKNVEHDMNACAPDNPADSFLEQWFGFNGGLANKAQISANLHKIRDELASFGPENFLYNDNPVGKTRNALAYVTSRYPNRIVLTPKFFGLPDAGVDTKPGTLIHEDSHPASTLNTDDLAYGPHDAAALAAEDKGKALMNADNYEYFNEGLAIDRQSRFQNAVNETARNFNDFQSGTCSK